MRIVVAPHDLAVGGSQINAIDLAAAVRDRGHDVVVFGVPGPLVAHIERRRLEFIAAPAQPYRPAPQRIVALSRLARRHNVDVIHGYEWPPALDAYFGGAGSRRGTALVCTVLSMHVHGLVPRSVPVVVGTLELGQLARLRGFNDVTVIEPPIDTAADSPAVDADPARRELALGAGEQLVVTVSRLAIDLKLDALERLIDAAGAIGATRHVRLAVVGGGEAEAALRKRAAAVNTRLGREVVTLVGERLDPRSFYAAADVVAGMGSSVLRAMSIGRPVVVQGERGFAEVFEPATAATFLRQGFWGHGEPEHGTERLARHLTRLLDDAAARAALGRFGRETVHARFGLARAAERIEFLYDSAICARRRRGVVEPLTLAARASANELRLHAPGGRRTRAADKHTRLSRAAAWRPDQLADFASKEVR